MDSKCLIIKQIKRCVGRLALREGAELARVVDALKVGVQIWTEGNLTYTLLDPFCPPFSKIPYLCPQIAKKEFMTIKEAIDSVVEEFEYTEDRMEKYEVIIDLGKELSPLPDELRSDQNIVQGCQSKVWLHADYQDGKVVFQADSDAIIPKGLIAILVRVLSNQKPRDIIDTDLDFLKQIGIWQHLSPNRSNGLSAMLKKMKYYALIFQN